MGSTPDFSGWATKHNIKCSDGLTIRGGAFAHNDGLRVPLLWSHDHSTPENVLGYAELENRPEGVYAHGFFNDTEMGQRAKSLVKHGDIESLSIYANKLVKQGNDVVHGQIRELSLVLSGANPGAFIDQVNISHSENGEMEAVIFSGEHLQHDESGGNVANPEKEPTVQDIIDTMTEEQKNVLYYLVGQAVEDAEGDDSEVAQSALSHSEEEAFNAGYDAAVEDVLDKLAEEADEDEEDEDFEHSDNSEYLAHEGGLMTGNVFARDGYAPEPVISHSEIKEIVADAQKGGSLKDSFLAHAESYGIENIDILFPNAKALSGPEFLKRQTEWVTKILGEVHKSPFARIKSVVADITADEARARGYIKGTQKKDEVIKLLKRETTPTTIYKKQKLDRDDVVDITDLDVVAWLKGEMKLMLNEEIARAILFGDGRDVESQDKIKEDNLRPIAKDVFPYTTTATASKADGYDVLIKNIIRSRKNFKGSGTPSLYASSDAITEMLLLEDKMGRPLFDDIDKLKTKLRVADIVEIPDALFKHLGDIFGVIVNLKDYTLGSDKGGETTMFEDFDIDFNQNKYLIETRLSGCLTKPESAIILKWSAEETPASGHE